MGSVFSSSKSNDINPDAKLGYNPHRDGLPDQGENKYKFFRRHHYHMGDCSGGGYGGGDGGGDGGGGGGS